MIQSKLKKYEAVLLLLVLTVIGVYGCGAAAQYMEETETEGKENRAVETEHLNYPVIIDSFSKENIVFTAYSEGIFIIFNGEAYGFWDKTGEVVADFVYEHAYPFSQGLACVRNEGKYGFINTEGEVAIPFIYDRANSYSEGLAYFEADGSYGFLNQKGEQAFLLQCDSISSFQEGLAYFSIDGKYGYIDQSGVEVIPPIYDDVDYFSGSIARVRKGIYFGVVDKQGREVIKTEYDSVVIEGEFIVVKSGNKFGCFDRNGMEVMPVIYDAIRVEQEKIVYREADEQDSVTVLLQPEVAVVAKEGRFGITDYEGNFIVPAVYEDISYRGVFPDMIFVAADGGKCGFFHMNELSERYDGELPLCYDEVRDYQDGMAVVRLNGKYSVVDREGKLLFDFGYESVRLLESGLLLVEKDGKYYLADRSGTMLGSGEYDEIIQHGESYRIETNGLYGFLNARGEEVIPPVYDLIGYDEVYQSSQCYIPFQWRKKKRSIIITGEPESLDLSAMLVKNEITPRISEFHELIESGAITVNDAESSHSVAVEELRHEDLSMRLYRVEGSSSPVLYVYSEPYGLTNFPLSHSAFFSVEDGQLKELLSGYQCGGSLGGDFVHLWFDREEEAVKFGVSGEFGGFGGYSYRHEIYSYEAGEMEEEKRFYTVTQETGNFLPQALLEHPEMYFDEMGNSYTKETILEAESLSEYTIDEEQTTPGRYYEMFRRYRF